MNEKKKVENIGFKSISVGETIINGIIGTIFGLIFLNIYGLVMGLLSFPVNVVAALTWEKNENIRTKSNLKIFFSPVIKGVIIGAGAGAIVYSIYGRLLGSAYVGLIYGTIGGVFIGLMQLLVGTEIYFSNDTS